MAVDASFIHFDPADLQTIKTACQTCLLDNFTAHQSYSIAGRTITRANIGQVSAILSAVNFAIKYQAGKICRSSVVDMSGNSSQIPR